MLYTIRSLSAIYMSRIERKPVFGVSNQVRHKLGCTATEDGQRLEIFGFRKQRDCTIYVAKTKAMISCVVTAPLFLHMQKTGFLMIRLIYNRVLGIFSFNTRYLSFPCHQINNMVKPIVQLKVTHFCCLVLYD